jgi:hypothetical protein
MYVKSLFGKEEFVPPQVWNMYSFSGSSILRSE